MHSIKVSGMTKTEYNQIRQDLEWILEDIGSNPDWSDAAECLAADFNTLDKRLKEMIR